MKDLSERAGEAETQRLHHLWIEMNAQLEEAKQFLKSAPADGSPSLYDHLSKVLLKIVLERPEAANQQFEEISAAVRATSLKKPQPLPEEENVSFLYCAQLFLFENYRLVCFEIFFWKFVTDCCYSYCVYCI